jgi:hypothetical protein
MSRFAGVTPALCTPPAAGRILLRFAGFSTVALFLEARSSKLVEVPRGPWGPVLLTGNAMVFV